MVARIYRPGRGEKYRTRFYNAEWDEVAELTMGSLSHMGALYVIADWLCGRLDDIEGSQLAGRQYKNCVFVSVEVDRG